MHHIKTSHLTLPFETPIRWDGDGMFCRVKKISLIEQGERHHIPNEAKNNLVTSSRLKTSIDKEPTEDTQGDKAHTRAEASTPTGYTTLSAK